MKDGVRRGMWIVICGCQRRMSYIAHVGRVPILLELDVSRMLSLVVGANKK